MQTSIKNLAALLACVVLLVPISPATADSFAGAYAPSAQFPPLALPGPGGYDPAVRALDDCNRGGRNALQDVYLVNTVAQECRQDRSVQPSNVALKGGVANCWGYTPQSMSLEQQAETLEQKASTTPNSEAAQSLMNQAMGDLAKAQGVLVAQANCTNALITGSVNATGGGGNANANSGGAQPPVLIAQTPPTYNPLQGSASVDNSSAPNSYQPAPVSSTGPYGTPPSRSPGPYRPSPSNLAPAPLPARVPAGAAAPGPANPTTSADTPSTKLQGGAASGVHTVKGGIFTLRENPRDPNVRIGKTLWTQPDGGQADWTYQLKILGVQPQQPTPGTWYSTIKVQVIAREPLKPGKKSNPYNVGAEVTLTSGAGNSAGNSPAPANKNPAVRPIMNTHPVYGPARPIWHGEVPSTQQNPAFNGNYTSPNGVRPLIAPAATGNSVRPLMRNLSLIQPSPPDNTRR